MWSEICKKKVFVGKTYDIVVSHIIKYTTFLNISETLCLNGEYDPPLCFYFNNYSLVNPEYQGRIVHECIPTLIMSIKTFQIKMSSYLLVSMLIITLI